MTPQEIRQTEEYKNTIKLLKELMPKIDAALNSIEDMCDEEYTPVINSANSISFVYHDKEDCKENTLL